VARTARAGSHHEPPRLHHGSVACRVEAPRHADNAPNTAVSPTVLRIHFSNRYETLAGLLFERLGGGGRSVFSTDAVIVPSAAVRRQLTLAIADVHGICANVEFGYLALWLWQLIARVVPGVQAESPFDPAVLVWRIFAALCDTEDDAQPWTARHPRLHSFLARADALMRHELATRLAALFDQYITFRPEWLAAWSRGVLLPLGGPDSATQADEAWQAELWQRLADRAGTAASPAGDFIAALRERGAALVASGTLPAEVHVFCLPTTPPLHLALLQALAGCADVHVYALNPCREYWFDVVDRRRLAYLAALGRADHHEEGQRLLAAWGRQAQSQLGQLVDAGGDSAVDDAHFEAPPAATMLARLQRSILELQDLAPGSVVPADDDRSLEVHVCHSLAREIEVLHDRLLGLFAADPTLAPGEILVVTPDLDAAAPLVDAVFGIAPRERRIAHHVTGLARTRANPAGRVLLELLALAGSRFTVSALFGLLQQPQVARRFGLDGDSLQRVHGWLQDAGVHWALDAEDRANFGLPAHPRHSLADGLGRLFLGYAMPARAAQPCAGLLPAGDAEGSDASALGALWRYAQELDALRRAISSPLPAPAWPPLLAGWLERFVEPADDEAEDLHELRSALQAWAADLQRSGFAQPLPLEVVRAAVANALDDPARGGVPSGAVTFAAMSSLRNLPYRVICAIGLNDGAFPTAARPAEFDLMAAQPPRPGDRQRRTDERNLFLDLLLAARETLHLSYVGRSVRDNSRLPPSVLVSELLEYLLPASRAQRERFVVEHPLQAFSEAAFRVDADLRLRSYGREIAQALQRRLAAPALVAAPLSGAAHEADAEGDGSALAAGGAEVEDDSATEPALPFFAVPLATPGDEWRDVSLAQLVQFFGNPCRYLLRHRLGIVLPRADDELQDDEPFLLDVTARSTLAARLLPALAGGADLAAARALALAGTEVPAGAFGRDALERELASLERFAQQVTELSREPLLPPHTVSIELAVSGQTLRLHGSFVDLRASGLVRSRYDDLRARDVLDAWLHHLLLCAAPPPGAAARTAWQARDECLVLPPCERATEVLGDLLGLYLRGLREPLYFFPKTAWKYMANGRRPSAAAGAWNVTQQHPFGEAADPAYRLALRGRPDPMGEGFPAFDACARAVFEPLLDGPAGQP